MIPMHTNLEGVSVLADSHDVMLVCVNHWRGSLRYVILRGGIQDGPLGVPDALDDRSWLCAFTDG